MMLHWHWVAMIISYLSTRVIVLPFHSIAEIVKINDYRLYVKPGSAHEDAFKLSTDPDWQKAWTEMIHPFLEEYKNYNGTTEQAIALATRDSKLAVYGNGFQVR
jgi:hypothetical protein